MAGLLLMGGGGHCRVVIDALREAGEPEPSGIVDLAERIGEQVLGVPIVGTEDDLPRLVEQGSELAFVTLGTVGVGDDRSRLFAIAKNAGLKLPVVVHPAATVSAQATLGEGTFVGAGAVIGVGAHIGANCIVNTGAVVDHDCELGDHVHVAPGVVMSGGVVVGERSLLGTGASVIQSVRIGACVVIGAGSTVVRDIPDGAVAYGVPCREVERG